MSAARGLVAGALGLTALEAVVSSNYAADNVSTTVRLAAGVVRRLVDPSVPLIPDLRPKKKKAA